MIYCSLRLLIATILCPHVLFVAWFMYLVFCYNCFLIIEKSRSDHLLQTTSIWALTTVFRMYPAEVRMEISLFSLHVIFHATNLQFRLKKSCLLLGCLVFYTIFCQQTYSKVLLDSMLASFASSWGFPLCLSSYSIQHCFIRYVFNLILALIVRITCIKLWPEKEKPFSTV